MWPGKDALKIAALPSARGDEEREDQRPDMIAATVYVDSPSQKQMLIGKAGAALKEVGMQARVEIEELVGTHVYVELWVKVNQKWRRKAGFVQAQGYGL